jgi:hypothetical protein
MHRPVKVIVTSLVMDEHVTFVVSPFGPFYLAMSHLHVTEVVLLADCVGRPSY